MLKLQRDIDPSRDHVRGRGAASSVVLYGDYLCPYCRKLRPVLDELRAALGERLVYVYRHFPLEHAHPGALLMSCAAEAAAAQGHFWEMHDAIYTHELPLSEALVTQFARNFGLDIPRFERDLRSDETRQRVEEDVSDGRLNGVTGTPTIFVDGMRYDGAWEFYSMLEAIERPVAARVQRRASAFARLPVSGGLILLLAAVAAIVCANTPIAPYYQILTQSTLGVGAPGAFLSLSVGQWCSEGLLSIFFLLVGLEIRREMTAGAFVDRRAAILPAIAAVGGVLAPAAIYLLLNTGSTARGWAVPTATDMAFTLAILALMGKRIPSGLRVVIAALAVADDVLSVITLAIFYPRSFEPAWLIGGGLAIAGLVSLNRWRVYALWPYVLVTVGLWLCLHAAGVHGALAGIILAAFLPTRPAPAAGPLLAQAATALAALDYSETHGRQAPSQATGIAQESIWDWASRNLVAASERLLSPADRIERAVAPWSTYVVLPLFAFSATGVSLAFNLAAPNASSIFLGVVLGLVIGKPLGILLASAAAIKSRIAIAPRGVGLRLLVGSACLCGVGDTVALLLASQAFSLGSEVAIAKIAVLLGSILAAMLGATVLVFAPKVGS